MISRIRRFVAAVLLSAALAAPAPAADYFPLHTGDVWYMSRSPLVIGGTETVDSLSCFRVYHGSTFNYYCHKTPEGKVYRVDPGQGAVLEYDLAAKVGDSWKCILHQLEFTVTLVSTAETVRTAFGEFTGCHAYSFKASHAYDADYIDYLAPDVGLVQKSSCWGTTSLAKARVEGRAIPASPPAPEVVRTLPAGGASGVPVDGYIKAFFSFDIDPSTVNSETFRVTSEKEGVIRGTFSPGSPSSYDMIEFLPEKPLPHDDRIEVTVTTGVRDYLDCSPAEPYRFSFSTEPPRPQMTDFREDGAAIATGLAWGDFDWGDCDADGDLDLIIFGQKGSFSGGVEWFENQGGSFEKHDIGGIEVYPDFGYGRNCVRWMDYTGDGLLDFIIAGKDSLFASRTIFYRRSGEGFVRDAGELPFGYASMDCRDYDGDGRPDLAISGFSRTLDHRTAVYRNNGGSFTLLENSVFPWESAEIVRWMDFDNDGRKDIFTLGPGKLSNSGFYANVDGRFVKRSLGISGDSEVGGLYYPDCGDVDHDGDIDLIAGPWLLTREKDSFRAVMIDNYSSGAIPVFHDLDRDGYDDLLIAGKKYDPVGRNRLYIQIYRNDKGILSLYREINLGRDLFIFSGRWSDLNRDGRPDLTLFTDAGFLMFLSTADIIVSAEAPKHSAPSRYHLDTHPNPFNSSISITFTLPVSGPASLTVYDITGRKVATLLSGSQPAGSRTVRWDAFGFASGVYFCRLEAGGKAAVRKMTLAK